MYKVNFRKICRKKRVTLSKLSRRCGIPQPSLSRYQSGRTAITLRQLNRITLAMSCKLNDILEERPNFLEKNWRKIVLLEENKSSNKDKAWVSKIIWDLRKHYLKVKK